MTTYMNISGPAPMGDQDILKYQVTYDVNGERYNCAVDETTVRMLKRAKEAGRSEMQQELQKTLGLR